MANVPAIPPRPRRLPLDPHRLRILILRAQLLDEEERHAAILARLIQERQRQLRGRRRWWVRPWIERRRLFGQFDTLFKELERESHGDYMSYIRMDPNLFGELLLRVTPRITKGPRYGKIIYHFLIVELFSFCFIWCSQFPSTHYNPCCVLQKSTSPGAWTEVGDHPEVLGDWQQLSVAGLQLPRPPQHDVPVRP